MTAWLQSQIWKVALIAVLLTCAIQLVPDRPAEADVAMKIAYINVSQVVDNHPRMNDIMRQVANFRRTKIDEVRKKFGSSDEKVDLNSEEGQRMMEETSLALQEVEAFQEKLIEELVKDIRNAAGKMGREAGVEIILASEVVLWGGLDLTPAMNSEMNRLYR
jgi:Skp family chaperone for outer membrane proteins